MEKNISQLASFLKKANSNKAEEVLDLIRDGVVGPILLTDKEVSAGLRYHVENNVPLTENVYRKFSDAYFSLLSEAKELYKNKELIVCADSEWILEGNLGEFAEWNGISVPLDSPMELEREDFVIKSAAEYQGKKVPIGKPRALRKGEPGHGRKQNVVYVKDGDKVKRITFGDPNLKAKPEKAKNRKSFRARHKCDQKKDKTKPGFWACSFPPHW